MKSALTVARFRRAVSLRSALIALLLAPLAVLQAAEPVTIDLAKRTWQGIPGIERTARGRVFASWFTGGPKEPSPENTVLLSHSDDAGKTFASPEAMALPLSDGTRCYDPCLWIDPKGRLWYLFNRSLKDSTQHGVYARICDHPDASPLVWGAEFRVGFDGPFSFRINKPIAFSTGEWIMPVTHALEPVAAWAGFNPKQVQGVGISTDEGKTWTLHGAVSTPGAALENMIVELRDGRLWMLIRTAKVLWESHSSDKGRTWTEGKPTTIATPHSRFFIRRLASGNLLLVNHYKFKGRNNLTAQLSTDDGTTWNDGLLLDERGGDTYANGVPGGVSYPDGVQDRDGLIWIIYDRGRNSVGEILLARFREKDMLAGKNVSGAVKLKQVISKLEQPAEHSAPTVNGSKSPKPASPPGLLLGPSDGPDAVQGRYTPDGRVVFDKRPIKEWEFMATGTGVTGLTVSFPDEMLIQVNHASAIDEQGKVRALARLHLTLEGSPFATSKSFRMETDFRRSLILVAAQTDSGTVRMEIRAHVPMDGFRIDVYDERTKPSLLRLRFEEDATSVALASGKGMSFLHENPKAGAAIKTTNQHWLAGRTFGLRVESPTSDSVQCEGELMKVPASNHQTLYLVGASERKGKDSFLKSVTERTAQLTALSHDEFIQSHEAWWRQFWARSYFEPDATKIELLRHRASFDLFRYYTACCTSDRRETPARFQIELFRYHLRQHKWLTLGLCAVEMYQSVFGTMRTGDWETLRSEFNFFDENLPSYRDQARRTQGVGGAFIPMSNQPWTNLAPQPPALNKARIEVDAPYNGDNPAGSLFMLALGCDYADVSNDSRFTGEILRPLASEVMEYFQLRYPSGKDGKIAFDPCNAGETWRAVRNPAEIICAFRFALPRLISVGEKHGWPESTLAQWRAMLAAAPMIPRGQLKFDDPTIKPEILPGNLLVPAEDMHGCKPYVLPWRPKGKPVYDMNVQQTELFAIWPTKLMLRNDADYAVAKESYEVRRWQHSPPGGWQLDVVHAACLGLRSEVGKWFGPHFDQTFPFPCGLASELAPPNPARKGIPDYPSLQGMGTGVIPVLEMLLSDFPEKVIILPCWDPKVAVRYALFSPYAGKVTVDYAPERGANVKTERPIRVTFGKDIHPAKQK